MSRCLSSLLVICLLAARGTAHATEISGSTTTIFRVYDLVNDQDDVDLGLQAVRSYRPLDEYLHLSVDKWGRNERWSFNTDVRGRVDLGGGKGVQDDFQVLLADVGWRSKSGLGVHFGRLSSTVGLGWACFDGARLDFDQAKHVKAFTYLGVPQDWGDRGTPDLSTWTGAFGFTLVAPKNGTFGMDYEITREGADTLSETAGADFSFGQKDWSFSGNTDYSFAVDRFGDSALELHGLISKAHELDARYTRIQPVFETDEIWNVYRVNPYEEYRLSYEYRGNSPWRVGGYVSREDYFENEFAGPQNQSHAAATVTYTGQRHARYRGELGWQNGWAAQRIAARVDADWDLTRRIRFGAGLSAGRYENVYRLDESEELWSVRTRVSYDHYSRWNLALELDDYIGTSSQNVRATLVFGAKFGNVHRSRPWWGGRWGDAWGGGTPTRAELKGDDDAALPAEKETNQ